MYHQIKTTTYMKTTSKQLKYNPNDGGYEEMNTNDELLMLNKHYNALINLYDALEQIELALNDADNNINLDLLNNEIKYFKYLKGFKRLDIEKTKNAIEKIKEIVGKEQLITSFKSQEVYNFDRLGAAIVAYKSIKNDNNPL